MDRVTVYEDEAGEYRWRRQSENGEVVSASGEGCRDKRHAERMAKEVNVDAEVVVDDA
jgi:uncharacterized protein YegP (UPF0339 family)